MAVAGGIISFRLSIRASVPPILMNVISQECLEGISLHLAESPLRLKDGLIRIWWSEVQNKPNAVFLVSCDDFEFRLLKLRLISLFFSVNL